MARAGRMAPWLCPLMLLAAFCPAALGQVPEYMSIQGLVVDQNGDPVTGYHSLTVRLYDGPTLLYEQTEAGTTTDGLYDYHVGPLDDIVFNKPLEVAFSLDGGAEFDRIGLESVPYALSLRGLRPEPSTRPYENATINLVGGAAGNTIATHQGGVIAGGGTATLPNAIVGGDLSVIGGGVDNQVENAFAGVISGGSTNRMFVADGPTIGGGAQNETTASYVTIGGGSGNKALEDYGTISGGYTNRASGAYATIPGGSYNEAAGDHSLAAGRYAFAAADGSFVWQDGTGFTGPGTLTAAIPNAFVARASGGFSLFTNPATTTTSTGAYLPPNDGSWASYSSALGKKDFTEIDPEEILAGVESLRIQRWRYKAQQGEIWHIGPMSEDFQTVFGLGTDNQRISTVDADGVALAAIQGLNARVRALQAENRELRERIESIEAWREESTDR